MKVWTLIIALALWSSLSAATVKISGEPDVEETDIYNSLPNDCYGGRDFFRVGTGFGGIKAILIFKNLMIPAGSEVTAVICSLFINDRSSTGSVEMFELYKNVIEGNETTAGCTNGCTPNDWDDANAFNWDTFHADCADDAGVDNTAREVGGCVADSADRASTLMDTQVIPATGNWVSFDPAIAYIQETVDGVTTEVKFIFLSDGSADCQFRSSEEGTNPPSLTITYTPPSQQFMIGK